MRERETHHGHPADQMAERQKLLRRKIAVGELVAEKHPHDRREREGIQNERLLKRAETQCGQVAKNQGQPGSPYKKLQHHHEKQFEMDGSIHARKARGTV